MTATLTARVFTGVDAATMSAAQSSVELTDADALSGGDVAPGSYSFERWLALRVDVAPANGATNFWLQNTGDLPDGVTIRFGVTDTPATPVDTVSSIATMELTSGRRFIFDTNVLTDVADLTRYIVLQEQALSSASSGAIDPQAFEWGWSEA